MTRRTIRCRAGHAHPATSSSACSAAPDGSGGCGPWRPRRSRARTWLGTRGAIGAYHASSVRQIARLRVNSDGTASLAIGGHEMGQGLRNVLSALLTSKLGVRPERITLTLGDTDAAPQHV